jgi:hypothetical protein
MLTSNAKPINKLFLLNKERKSYRNKNKTVPYYTEKKTFFQVTTDYNFLALVLAFFLIYKFIYIAPDVSLVSGVSFKYR